MNSYDLSRGYSTTETPFVETSPTWPHRPDPAVRVIYPEEEGTSPWIMGLFYVASGIGAWVIDWVITLATHSFGTFLVRKSLSGDLKRFFNEK